MWEFPDTSHNVLLLNRNSLDKISISRAGRQIDLSDRNLTPQTKWSRKTGKTKLACSRSYANFV